MAGLVPALERFDVRVRDRPGPPYDNPTLSPLPGAGRREPDAAGLGWREPGDVIRARAGCAPARPVPNADDVAAPLPEDDINNASVVHAAGERRIPGAADGRRRGARRGHAAGARPARPASTCSRSAITARVEHAARLLAAVHPAVALISCGVDNEYGHPHAITLEHLAGVPGLASGAPTWRARVEVVADAAGHRQLAAAPRRDAGSIGAWWYPVATRRSQLLDSLSLPDGIVVHSTGVARVAAEAARLVSCGRRSGRRAARRGRRPAARHRQAGDARRVAGIHGAGRRGAAGRDGHSRSWRRRLPRTR